MPAVRRVGTTNLTISSTTLVIGGTAGVTDNLDVGVAIPMVMVAERSLNTRQRRRRPKCGLHRVAAPHRALETSQRC